jgi:hypothetical protein
VLAHLGGLAAGYRDLVGRPQRHQLALDLRDLAPLGVAQDQPVAQAEDLAVHVQDGSALLVGYVGVLAQAEEALADQVHRVSSLLDGGCRGRTVRFQDGSPRPVRRRRARRRGEVLPEPSWR